MKINDSTTVQVDTSVLDTGIIEAQLNDLRVTYVQAINWLYGYPMVVANNNPEKEADLENLAKLEKEKENIENNLPNVVKKIKFFQDILNAVKNAG